MTRGEVAQILHNLLLMLGTGPDTTGPDTTGPDTTGPDTTGPDTTQPTGPDTTGPDTTDITAYSLATSVSGGNGKITRSPDQATYAPGSTVVLTASSLTNADFFDHWSGSASGSTNPLTVVMDSNKTIVANFVTGFGLLTDVPTGHGTITRNPSRIIYRPGSSVTLTAVPDAGFKFTGWGDDASGISSPLTAVMNAEKSISASFAPDVTYLLDVAISPTGAGTVNRNPSKTGYNQGESVVLTATPGEAYFFDHWSGSAGGTTNPLTLVMNSNKAVTAIFGSKYKLTTSVAGGSGTITRSPNKTYFMPGEMVTLTAVPAAGYLFHRWGGDADGMFTSPLTVIMNSDVNDTAYFARAYTLTVSSAGEERFPVRLRRPSTR